MVVATLALTISYDGAAFVGSQFQRTGRTVQGVLGAALASIYGAPPDTVFAGRTDTGVHAAGQVVSFVPPSARVPTARLAAALNHALPDDLSVVAVSDLPGAFNARFAATWREYRYRVWSGQRDPLARRTVWWRSAALDVEAMRQAATMLLGRHDFAAFAGGGEGVPWADRRRQRMGTVRTLFASEVRELEPWWGPRSPAGQFVEYRVVGDGFLPRMVRSLVAALVDVARGARAGEWIGGLLDAGDRRLGGGTAPAHGLTLWQIGYAPYPRMGMVEESALRADGRPPNVDDRMDAKGRMHRGTADLVTEGA